MRGGERREGGQGVGEGGLLNVTSEYVISSSTSLSYMTTPALVVLPVVVKFVALRLQSDRWMWRVSTLMHIWCMAQGACEMHRYFQL